MNLKFGLSYITLHKYVKVSTNGLIEYWRYFVIEVGIIYNFYKQEYPEITNKISTRSYNAVMVQFNCMKNYRNTSFNLEQFNWTGHITLDNNKGITSKYENECRDEFVGYFEICEHLLNGKMS